MKHEGDQKAGETGTPPSHSSENSPSDRRAPDEEKFRLLVQSIKDYAIFLLDENGVITSWNEGAERTKGYSESEIIGKHFSIFYSAEDRARSHPQKELEIALSVGRYEEEGWRVRKDGSLFWANVVITALRNRSNRPAGFAKVTRDLSERKKALEDLKASEERTRLIIESVKDYAIFMLSPEGLIQGWNEGARRIKGYEEPEVIGRHFSIFYPQEDIDAGKCEFELTEAARIGRFEDEGWRKRKDGTLFWANVVLTAIQDPKRKLLGFSKVTRDITEARNAAEKLRIALENTEKLVAERTRELSESNRRLKDAVRIRDEFLSIASHELKTPVTPLRLQIQGLIRQVKNKSLHQLPENSIIGMAQTCERGLTRLSALIDNLLDVSSINSGKLQLKFELTDLALLVREVVDRHSAQAENAKTPISLTAAESVYAVVDRLRIEQVLNNIFSNALKYGRGMPVTVMVSCMKSSVEITVQDGGAGISAADQERIFGRFERATKDQSISGLGLGLFISRQIVEAHEGKIWVENGPAGGSKFIVSLPLSMSTSTS